MDNGMMTLEERLQYQFQRPELLTQALTHRSFKEAPQNEVLEFLGDAVLGLVISDMLIAQFPEDSEGPLSRRRASLVNSEALADVALGLELSQWILLGKGEMLSGGAQKPRLLASVLEAILGAIYQDSGFASAADVIRRLFAERVSSLGAAANYDLDFKTRLQEWAQKTKIGIPKYVLVESQGPDHDKEFHVAVHVNEVEKGRGVAKNKKQAEQIAARVALESLDGKEL